MQVSRQQDTASPTRSQEGDALTLQAGLARTVSRVGMLSRYAWSVGAPRPFLHGEGEPPAGVERSDIC